MEKNVGTTERYIRIGLGLAAGLVAFKMRKSKLASGLLATAAASVIKSGVTQRCAVKEKLGIGAEGAKEADDHAETRSAKRSFPPAPVQDYGTQSGAI